MRKPFKSFLRHGPISKRQIVEGPTDPEIVDVTILPQWDTVLRYDGRRGVGLGRGRGGRNCHVTRCHSRILGIADANYGNRNCRARTFRLCDWLYHYWDCIRRHDRATPIRCGD